MPKPRAKSPAIHLIGEPGGDNGRSHGKPAPQTSDPFSLDLDGQVERDIPEAEQSAYRPDEFLIPAADHQGHKEKRWYEIAPGYANQIGSILASKKFPYRSEGSFTRHAIHRHIRWLATLEPLQANVIAVLESINRAVHTQELMLEFADSLQKIEKVVYDLSARGMRAEAKRMVWDIRHQAEQIDMPAWRVRFLEDMVERFGYLMVGDAVSLNPDGEGEDTGMPVAPLHGMVTVMSDHTHIDFDDPGMDDAHEDEDTGEELQ